MDNLKPKPITMPFGKFKGMPVVRIPNSYLRWLITVKDVPEFIREEAKRKLESSDFDDTDIEITRHAIDMFSKRFLHKWNDRKFGLGTFVAHFAIEALAKGKLIVDERSIGRGAKFFYDDVVWVFAWSDELPQYKSLLTVMKTNEEYEANQNTTKTN